MELNAYPSPTFSDLASKIAGQSFELVQSIQRIRLREDLKEAGRAVGQELRRARVPVSFVPIGARERGQSPTLRVGVKELALDRVQWWLHFSDSEQKHWADIVRFSDVEAARDYYRRSRQRYSGIYAAVGVGRQLPDGPPTDPDVRVNASGSSLR